MGKNRQRQQQQRGGGGGGGGGGGRSSSSAATASDDDGRAAGASSLTTSTTSPSPPVDTSMHSTAYSTSLLDWVYAERTGLAWVIGCAFVGSLLGLGVGTGHLTGGGGFGRPVAPWRVALAGRIRSSIAYRALTPWSLGTAPSSSTSVPRGTTSMPSSSSPSSMLGLGKDSPPVGDGISDDEWSSAPWPLRRIMHLLDGFGVGLDSSSSSSSPPPLLHSSGRSDPSHPLAFAALREMVVREDGGFVHPDLGLLSPAPCGAARGLGVVRTSYRDCQVRCFPGLSEEKLAVARRQRRGHVLGEEADDDEDSATIPVAHGTNVTTDLGVLSALSRQSDAPPSYHQEEVLLRIPLATQMTRAVALRALHAILPPDVRRRAPPDELDDGPLLALLLAHERGRGRESPWLSYISSLPADPPCGFSSVLRPDVAETVTALGVEMGLDVNGWPAEIGKAAEYAERVSSNLAKDYGPYLSESGGSNGGGGSSSAASTAAATDAILWALCQVSTRGVAGSMDHGALRLVPVLDMINHDADAGTFVELTGKERLEKGDLLDTTEDDNGAFIVRSMRHGRPKPLKKGQELLANYNVPNYSPLDWFLSLGFVPPERSGRWTKVDAALPRVRGSGGSGGATSTGAFGGGKPEIRVIRQPRPEL